LGIGIILSGSIIKGPVEHNSKEKNDQLKKIYKLVLQRIIINHTVYKHHIIVNQKTKLIHNYEVTTAKIYVILSVRDICFLRKKHFKNTKQIEFIIFYFILDRRKIIEKIYKILTPLETLI